LKLLPNATGAGASKRALQQQHTPVAEEFLTGPRPFHLIVFAAAQGARLDTTESFKRSDASFVKHVAAAQYDLQSVGKCSKVLARSKANLFSTEATRGRG
jgi:hypothetical protein